MRLNVLLCAFCSARAAQGPDIERIPLFVRVGPKSKRVISLVVAPLPGF
jgi:hypothetical protein